MATFTGSFENDVVRCEWPSSSFWGKEGEPDSAFFIQVDLQVAGIMTGDTRDGNVVFIMTWNCCKNIFMTANG